MIVAQKTPASSFTVLTRCSPYMNIQILPRSGRSNNKHLQLFLDPFRESMAAPTRKASLSDEHGNDHAVHDDKSSTYAVDVPSSEEDSISPPSISSTNPSRTSSSSSSAFRMRNHTIQLSSIEHCMPRAYIRVCLAYRVPDESLLEDALSKLNKFVRKTVNAKPYLAGYVKRCGLNERHVGQIEMQFSTYDFLRYPDIEVRHLSDADGRLVDYNELDKEFFPPSRLKPEEVSVLPTNVADDDKAPIFRVQANIVKGGLIVTFYLHHCISDGQGIGLLVSGKVLDDDFTFQRHLNSHGFGMPSLEDRLAAFAGQKTALRQQLSWSSPNQINSRNIACKYVGSPDPVASAPGRGCVLLMPRQPIKEIVQRLRHTTEGADTTYQNVLMAILWRAMTKARRPSLKARTNVTSSKLLIPVDIRHRINPNLSDSYFGAAVDFAKTELEMDFLAQEDESTLGCIAQGIRKAVNEVDEDYVRQAIALALSTDPTIDVRDLQASNMDRATGADMYITSWLKLPMYKADLGMDLGTPEWVRKPWSKDPGSCIILPERSEDSEIYEVVVQMTETDMSRLLEDEHFMKLVSRVID